MRLEWLIDLLSVMEQGSINRAAEKRFLSQPAFSRRMKVIEEYIGVELLDRTRKPIQVKPQLLEQKQKIRDLVNGFNALLQDIQHQENENPNKLVIASQHSLTTAVVPSRIRLLLNGMDATVYMKSANRDDCFAMLMTKQAEVMLVYCTEDEPLSSPMQFLDQQKTGNELLIPVCAHTDDKAVRHQLKQGEIRILAYPHDVYFGEIMQREIYPILRKQTAIRIQAETSLTTASLQCALSGVGVAWVPESLARAELHAGHLSRLDEILPSVDLSIVAIRLHGERTPVEERFWQIVTQAADSDQ